MNNDIIITNIVNLFHVVFNVFLKMVNTMVIKPIA
ncbi:hypothetical protein ACTFIY_005422 [Dictyostelium cf. discoideum]